MCLLEQNKIFSLKINHYRVLCRLFNESLILTLFLKIGISIITIFFGLSKGFHKLILSTRILLKSVPDCEKIVLGNDVIFNVICNRLTKHTLIIGMCWFSNSNTFRAYLKATENRCRPYCPQF